MARTICPFVNSASPITGRPKAKGHFGHFNGHFGHFIDEAATPAPRIYGDVVAGALPDFSGR